MSFEREPVAHGDSGEIEKGISACLYLKEKEPDPLHWGNIDCLSLTPDEAALIEKFDALTQKTLASETELFALDAEMRKALNETGSNVVEVLINELVALRYEMKHKNPSKTMH